jgi:hypothetical protein
VTSKAIGDSKLADFIRGDGWLTVSETWTRASANTFTVSGDKTDKYTKGSKVKFTDGGSTTHKCYVVSSSYSSPNTTVTVASEDDIASGTITNPYYSYADCPQGFKRGQDWYNIDVYSGRDSMSGNQQVQLDTEIKDVNGDFNTATYTYTVPISGFYLINGQVEVGSDNPDLWGMYGRIYINGSSSVYNGLYVYDNASAKFRSNICNVVATKYLTKGDTVKLYASADGGTNPTNTCKLFINFVGV